MNKTKLITVISIILLCFATIFLLVDNEKMNKQNEQISELESKIQLLEKNVSNSENEKKELESNITQLQEIVKFNNKAQSFSNLNSIIPQSNIENSLTGRGFATVVYRQLSCDYFILENTSGYIVAEWMGGNDPDQGDKITGNFDSFGTKDFYNQTSDNDCRFWIDDYMLSKESALEKINDKCN